MAKACFKSLLAIATLITRAGLPFSASRSDRALQALLQRCAVQLHI